MDFFKNYLFKLAHLYKTPNILNRDKKNENQEDSIVILMPEISKILSNIEYFYVLGAPVFSEQSMQGIIDP
jgi:hypothetical protein